MATKLDAESKSAARVLAAIAASNERLIALKRKVQARPGIIEVRQALELRGYESGPVLEGYVDAELANGRALAWWLEVHWTDGGWLIDCSIRIDQDEGEDIVKAFPSRTATTLDGFLAELAASVTDLLRSADDVDLALT